MLDNFLAELKNFILPLLNNVTMPTLPPAEALLACAVTAVLVSFVIVGSFGPFFAIASEAISIRTKRGFFARAASQITQMTLTIGIIAAFSIGGLVAWAIMKDPAILNDTNLLAAPFLLPLAVSGGALLAAILLLAVYLAVRPQKGLAGPGHLIVGILASLCAAFSFFCCIGVVRRLLHSPPDGDMTLPWMPQLLQFFSIPADSFFWPLLIQSIPLGLAFAAAFACIWLLLMRGKQDYGRDYYTFALPYCARWAAGFTLLAVCAGVYVFHESRAIMLPELSNEPSLLLDGLTAGLPLLAGLIWLLIARSAHPMRHKISVTLACIFLLTGFMGQVLMLNNIIPSP